MIHRRRGTSAETKTKKSSRVILGAALVAVTVAATLFLFHRPEPAQKPEASKVATGAGMRAIAEIVEKRQQETKLHDAEETVAEKNRAGAEQVRRLQEAGWEMVDDVAPPDLALVRLDVKADPALLDKRERELQAQMQSNGYTGDDLGKLRAIAAQAPSEKTRVIAIEALARSSEPKAQAELMALYRELPADSDERRQILGSLRPSSFADPASDFLIEIVSDPSTSDTVRKQAAMPLLVMSQMTLPSRARGEASARVAREHAEAELLKRIPARLQDEIRTLGAALAQAGAE